MEMKTLFSQKSHWGTYLIYDREGKGVTSFCGEAVGRLAPFRLFKTKKYEFRFVVVDKLEDCDVILKRVTWDVRVRGPRKKQRIGDFFDNDVMRHLDIKLEPGTPTRVAIELWELEKFPWE